MRIFLITSKLSFEQNGSPVGGSVVDLHLKAKGLTLLGHEVSVVTAFSESNKLFTPLPYAVIERRVAGRGLVGLQRGVYALLKEFESKADAFYVDGHMFLYGGGAYRMLGGKVPVTGFFNIRLNSWADTSGNAVRPSLYRRLKKRVRFFLEKTFGTPVANHLDALIFNTPHVQKLYREFGVRGNKQSAVLQDFVATKELGKRFAISKERIKEHQRSASLVTLLATGRMIPEKGFDLLLRAFAKVKDKQNYKVILSGGGPDKERLETLSKELGIGSLVTFPGWVPREELYRFFADAHVFVFPRWWLEYGSAVLTEAMAFGLPSIIPGGGALEWLTAGAALTFQNESIDEMRECIEAFGNSALRQTYAEKSLSQGEALDYKTLALDLEEVLTAGAR
ncbi:MAG: glycosyltransferase family 4 protein [bacterium]|nr:glycosyltransferase family 4 protein [bacterium]